jgi:hypothetical protein
LLWPQLCSVGLFIRLGKQHRRRVRLLKLLAVGYVNATMILRSARPVFGLCCSTVARRRPQSPSVVVLLVLCGSHRSLVRTYRLKPLSHIMPKMFALAVLLSAHKALQQQRLTAGWCLSVARLATETTAPSCCPCCCSSHPPSPDPHTWTRTTPAVAHATSPLPQALNTVVALPYCLCCNELCSPGEIVQVVWTRVAESALGCAEGQ